MAELETNVQKVLYLNVKHLAYVKCLVGIITYSNVFCLRWLVGCFPQSGEMDIENHTTKDVCHLKYDAYNYFGRDTPRKVDKSSMYYMYLFKCPFEA